MYQPKLLLLDEPSLGLASKLIKEVFKKIAAVKKNFGATILIVEHNLKSAFSMVDYGFVMVNGEIVTMDTCANLKDNEILQKVFVGEFD